MVKIHEGRLDASGKKVAIVASRFNELVTNRLLEGALDCLHRHGADEDAVDVYWVPGSFEVPQMARKIAGGGRYDGMLCLATLIRGETAHFDLLAGTVVRSLDRLAAQAGLPVTMGVVAAESMEQAMERAGAKQGNKGWQGALALIEMMKLWES